MQHAARYLQDEIAALKPDTVCVMGNTALQSVLGKYGITENRGKITIQDGVRYYPMVHPAATIYNRKLWPVLKKDIAILLFFTMRSTAFNCAHNAFEVLPLATMLKQ